MEQLELPELTYTSHPGIRGETVLELDAESIKAYNDYLARRNMARIAMQTSGESND